jgi:mannosyltransferase
MLHYLLTHSPLLYFTQSLWRDEVFSIFVASQPVISFFTKLSFEPPLYYLLLHFWIKIFGISEIATRSLSFIGFALATIVVIEWSNKIFKKTWLTWGLPLLFFVNPMLIYYAFEVRTYGWYIFFAVLSMYAYLEKKWLLFLIANIGGFYTHTYFIFNFATEILHYLIFNGKQLFNKKIFTNIRNDIMIRSSLICILFMIPWIFQIAKQLTKLKSSWYFPVDFHLIKSVIGNMFVGYEGTPWFLWNYTFLLSILLIFFMILAFVPKKTRPHVIFFLLSVFVPIIIVIGISFIKPLYVNRYLISVTISEIFLLGYAVSAIKNPWLNRVLGGVMILICILFNSWYPQEHPKVPIRDTMREVNFIRTKNDLVYATSSLVYFETLYYSKYKSGVYLYNPSGSAFPWYVGDAVFSKSQMVSKLPLFPQRAILVNPDGSYTVRFRTTQTDIKP